MKILLTHRYFWPDTAPYALMLRTIGEHLFHEGHDVHVFASVPSYRKGQGGDVPRKQQIAGMNISRIWAFQEQGLSMLLRVVNVIIYCVGLFAHILRLRPDVVTVSTFPPVIAAWTGSLAAKLVGAKFIYHMQDIHPEVSKYSGGRLGSGIPFQVMRWLDNQTLQRSSCIVVLSEDMAQTLAQRSLGNLPIHVINNFCLETFSETVRAPDIYTKDPRKKRIIFAGNMGRYQNLSALADGIALALDSHPDIELVFMGSGAAKQSLQTRWADHPQIVFLPYLPYTQAQAVIADSSVGLVSLQANIFRVAYPSKVLTYAALGLPILALVEPDSALAADIKRQNWGHVSPNSTPHAIAATLDHILTNAGLRHTRDLSINDVLPKWLQLLESLKQ